VTRGRGRPRRSSRLPAPLTLPSKRQSFLLLPQHQVSRQALTQSFRSASAGRGAADERSSRDRFPVSGALETIATLGWDRPVPWAHCALIPEERYANNLEPKNRDLRNRHFREF
jgi:hypothetical protein